VTAGDIPEVAMKSLTTITAFGLMALLTGCAGMPKWAKKGAVALPATTKVFYGVGQAGPGINSEDLRREAADNRARADLQRYFDTYTGYLMKEYQGDGSQQVERVIKTFSAGHLFGVRIADRYVKKGIVYSLAKLDLEEFRKVVLNAPELTPGARKFLEDRSEKLFDQLREEETRHGVIKDGVFKESKSKEAAPSN
jgi:hypothetical protein